MKGKYLGWWCIWHISEYYLQKPFGFVRYFLLQLSVLDTKKIQLKKSVFKNQILFNFFYYIQTERRETQQKR